MKPYWQLIRIHHWIKNGLIFLPLFFSGQFFDMALLIKNLLGFLAFSLTASLIYIINDVYDVENDRKHPIKSLRPIASGAVALNQAYTAAGVVLALALSLNFLTNNISGINAIGDNFNKAASWAILGAYLVLNYTYSRGLKDVPLMDIAILVSGFILRVLYGATISNIQASHWLYLTVIALSFYMGLGKRRNEIIKQGKDARGVLKHYNYNFLDKNMYMCLALTIIFYALWTVDTATIARYGTYNLIWTVPVVMLICMKYSLNIEQSSHGDPVDVVLGDKVLLGLILLFLIIMLVIIYFLA
jgi:4-hydroxybenzoate polyprenyltransferase